MVLDKIQKENDIKKISKEELPVLAQEIREFLIQKISETGGHLASNLGVVELTMALHLTLNFPEDVLIWDVGHQSYTHKLLTGRREGFDTLRKFGGMSGFPKRKESPCDSFDTGHSSTSVSAGLGYAMASQLQKKDNTIISVIGDGSMTGGMAWEALNNASGLKRNFIIVLNDNNMSISENVGGLSAYLNSVRTTQGYQNLKAGVQSTLSKIPGHGEQIVRNIRKTKNSIKQFLVPGMLFEEMGVTYLGPIDGHNIDQICRTIKEAQQVKGAVLVHVCTQKGRGYEPAMRNPARFHGTEPFQIETGVPKKKKEKSNYTDVFSTVMMKMGEREPNVVAVTAAMPDGTGLKRFQNLYPERFFDVGIAEQHAVTFSAGMAASGLIPVFAVYSSFLQRAFDQVLHDVCMQNLHVIFAIDRAGLVGSDGETHQGAFDLSFLSTMPNMTVMAPKNKWELSDMMKFAVKHDGPVAIRYPRGEAYDGLSRFRKPIEYGKWEIIYDESEIALVAVGSMVKVALEAREMLRNHGLACSLVNARFVKPLDEEMLRTLQAEHKLIVTLEENVKAGGFGEQVLDYLNEIHSKVSFMNISIPDEFVEHGNVDLLRQEMGIDAASVVKRIMTQYFCNYSEPCKDS
ncbi:MAG: 1-deoxy-D-xylulose-5-phosphate synthase [Muricoprocola sp.]